jgi:hypothetical protein
MPNMIVSDEAESNQSPAGRAIGASEQTLLRSERLAKKLAACGRDFLKLELRNRRVLDRRQTLFDVPAAYCG